MAKKSDKANHQRTASRKGVQQRNEVEITDENPSYCTYANPPGMKYVEATVTSPAGKVLSDGLICMSNDQLARIKASEGKKKK